jgi:multiple sugar transport system substrate-binding protein
MRATGQEQRPAGEDHCRAAERSFTHCGLLAGYKRRAPDRNVAPRGRTSNGALLALVLSAPLLAGGCDGATADGVELRFWGFGREGEMVAELIPDFERENPGIRVRVQQIPWTAAHEKLLTAFVGKATPDIAQLGNTWVPEFAMLGALAPLDTAVARSIVVDPDDFFEGAWDANVVRDSLYGLPWYVDTRVYFYRTDLLARAGWSTPPTDMAEWLEALRALKATVGGDDYVVMLDTNDWRAPVIFGVQTGSALLRDDGRYGAFSDPAFRRGFELYVELFREGLAPPNTTQTFPNIYQAFAAGNISVYLTGPWNIGEFGRRLPEDLQEHWATAPLPSLHGDAPGLSVAGGSSLVVFEASKHKEAAWKLLEYLSAPERQVRFYELTGDLPPRRSAWTHPSLADNAHARAFREQLEHMAAMPAVPEWEQIATLVMQRAESVVLGRASTEEALRALDRDVARVLEKRRWLLGRDAG